MKDVDFPTVDPVHPYELTEEESKVMLRLQQVFMRCEKLQRHVNFCFPRAACTRFTTAICCITAVSP